METVSKIAVQLFVGALLTPSLKRELHRNSGWKEKFPVGISGNVNLIEVLHRNKNYLGIYQKGPLLTLTEFKKSQESILKILKLYCPELDLEKVVIVVFPQIFVG